MVVLLVRPPDTPQFTKAGLEQLQEQHLANIVAWPTKGRSSRPVPSKTIPAAMSAACSFSRPDSLEEARSWVATDPLIKAGRLKAEYLKWYVEKGSLK